MNWPHDLMRRTHDLMRNAHDFDPLVVLDLMRLALYLMHDAHDLMQHTHDLMF